MRKRELLWPDEVFKRQVQRVPQNETVELDSLLDGSQARRDVSAVVMLTSLVIVSIKGYDTATKTIAWTNDPSPSEEKKVLQKEARKDTGIATTALVPFFAGWGNFDRALNQIRIVKDEIRKRGLTLEGGPFHKRIAEPTQVFPAPAEPITPA